MPVTGKPIGDTILFFGCRHRDEDFLYQEELEGYERDGVVTGLHVAFSRDQPQKVYVQDRLLENAATIWSLISNQGCFYVCGCVVVVVDCHWTEFVSLFVCVKGHLWWVAGVLTVGSIVLFVSVKGHLYDARVLRGQCVYCFGNHLLEVYNECPNGLYLPPSIYSNLSALLVTSPLCNQPVQKLIPLYGVSTKTV